MLAVLMSMVGMDAMAYEIEFNGIWYDLNRQWEAYVSNGSGFNIQAHYSGDVTIPDYVINNGSLYEVVGIKSEAFRYSPNLSHVTIPNTVTYIGDYAFSGCSYLRPIDIPNSVTYIGDRAFAGCSSLHSIVIPNSVTYIGPVPFIGCESITSIVVADGNPKYDSRDGCNAIIETATNSLVQGCNNSTIPNSVTSIGDHAFSNCWCLTSIEIPNSVTSIGNDAFAGCGLTSVTIPNSVTIIGDRAFRYCNLTSFTIPSSVTSIGIGAFYDCKLSEVYCYAEKVPETHSTAFLGSNIAYATLYVPAGSVEAYKSTAPWNEFKQILPIGSTGINNNVADYKEKAADIYTLDSKKVPSLREGVNIVRMSDGTTRKVIGK